MAGVPGSACSRSRRAARRRGGGTRPRGWSEEAAGAPPVLLPARRGDRGGDRGRRAGADLGDGRERADCARSRSGATTGPRATPTGACAAPGIGRCVRCGRRARRPSSRAGRAAGGPGRSPAGPIRARRHAGAPGRPRSGRSRRRLAGPQAHGGQHQPLSCGKPRRAEAPVTSARPARGSRRPAPGRR